MPHTTLGSPIPVLDVQHVEDALSYYVNRLGFVIDFRYSKEPDHYAGVKRDNVRLHVRHRSGGHSGNGSASHSKFRIPVDDPDALFAEFRAMGVLDDDVEVHDTEWSTREFGFQDPDGNGLVFFKVIE